MSYFRWLASWTTFILFTSCFTFRTTWGHRQVITSAFIKRNNRYNILSSGRRRQFPQQEKESSAQTVETAATSRNFIDCSDVILNTRGGSSYADDYNDGYNDGYGNYYQEEGQDDGRGYNDDGYYRRNDGNDDIDQGYSTRYYEDDTYHGRSSGGGSGYYDDEGRYHEDYDDRGRGSSSRRKSKTKLPTALTSSNRKLGIIFLSSGAAFTILGITLFFNKTLMRLGNLLFVAGIPAMLGPGRTIGYFLQPQKARATGCLGCGIFLVFVGHPVIGILLEIFGLLNLFGNMFPLVMMMAKNLPVVGGLFGGNNNNNGSRGAKRKSRYEDDRYYDDEMYDREYRRDGERY